MVESLCSGSSKWEKPAATGLRISLKALKIEETDSHWLPELVV